VLLGGLLVLGVRGPVPQGGAPRGHRVFGVGLHAVEALDVSLGERRFAAQRGPGGWTVDGRPAGPGTASALDDLAVRLVALRATDVFRPGDGADFGFAHPRAEIVLRTARGVRRVTLGDPNAAASAVYARRAGDARVMQIGIGILSDVERVLYNRARETDSEPR
jgi:hypothetical protein